MLLLLETPSGFAILSFDGVQLYLPGAKEVPAFLMCSPSLVVHVIG